MTNIFSGPKKIILLLGVSIFVNILFIGNNLVKRYGYLLAMHSRVKKISYYLNRQSIFAVLPVTSTDVVLAGDSYSQFFETDEYLSGYQIKNRGIYGDVSAGLLNRMDQITYGRPKKIFLEIGFNDIGNITPDSVCTNIKLIVKDIKQKSPNSLVYINNIFPSSREYYKKRVPEFNVKIKQLCKENNIPYIDVYSKLVGKDGLLVKTYDCGDGIHLKRGRIFSLDQLLKTVFIKNTYLKTKRLENLHKK